jgi:hypothetical protein
MGWRGAGGNGAANIGSYYSFGGILMILGSIGEVSASFSKTDLSVF